MALYGANCALGAPLLETPTTPTDNLLDAHLSSLTTISALTFSVAIRSYFMPRLKSKVVNCCELVNCRELLQSSAQRRPQCWRDERNCLPERQYTTHTPESVAVGRSSADRLAMTRCSALARIAISLADSPVSASRSVSPTMFQSNGRTCLAASLTATDRAPRSARCRGLS